MKEIAYFFTDPVASKVLIGVSVIGLISGLIGVFAFLRKNTLIGDAISHSVFPGVCIGFIYAGTKDPTSLLVGAVLTGWISVLMINYLSTKTKLKEDTSIALVSTFFFAIGSVLYSFITAQNGGNESGLKTFLFGKAATLTINDITIFIVISVIILLLVLLFQRHFKLLTFNAEFAQSIGVNVKLINVLLSTMTVVIVAMGVEIVGVVLMSALLIGPSATARYWTNNFKTMQVFAAVFGVVGSIVGVVVSSFFSNMPTGPWIVTVLFVMAMITFLIAPKKGWLYHNSLQRKNADKMNAENIIKIAYQLKEIGKVEFEYKDILEKRIIDSQIIISNIRQFKKKNWLVEVDGKFRLTDSGNDEGARIVRLHRLWELYLTKRLNFKADHIHGAAETVEHLLTAEMEEELLSELEYPMMDPHDKEIPYKKSNDGSK